MKLKFYFAFVLAGALLGGTAVAEEAKAEKPKAEKAEKKGEKGKKGEKPSDEAALKAKSEDFTKALIAGEVDKVMAYFSEDFKSPMFADKAAVKAIIETGVSAGVFTGMTTDGSEAKYEVKGDKATFGPWKFDASGTQGTVTFEGVKKGDEWSITSLTLEGVYL